MPKVLANGIHIHYQQAGEGPDVVLIHGVTGDLSTWYLHVMPALAKEVRVTAYDLRGHGYSEMTPSGYTSANMAADLHGLLDSLGIERAHLVGHSFGAAVALHCAVLYPERVDSLVLADLWIPALRSFADLENWPYLEAAKTRLRERGLLIPEDKWFDLEYIARQALRSPIRVGLRRGMERNTRRLQRLLDGTSALTEALQVADLTVERIAEIRQPTLAIYGEDSPFLQIAWYLREKMPSCQVAVLKGIGHMFALLKPELLVESVTEFLHGLARTGTSEPSGGVSIPTPDGEGSMSI